MRIVFLFVLFVLGVVGARAATLRAIDNVGTPVFASATSITWSHTLGDQTACPHSILIAVCGNDASTITSIAYGGVPLTSRVALASTETSQIWTLSNSTMTGTNNLTATFGAAVNGICASVSFCGANDTSPVDATASQQQTGINPSLAVTVVSSGSWIVDSMFNNGSTFVRPASAPANIVSTLNAAGGPSTLLSQITGPAPAGSNILSWFQGASQAWTKTILSIKPSTGTPIIVTNVPTTIGFNSATGNGVLLSSAGFAVSAQGICYATHSGPDLTDTCVSASGTPFTASLTGLRPGTSYHVRAYATNSEGTDYGADIPFVTAAPTGTFVSSGSGQTTLSTGLGTILSH